MKIRSEEPLREERIAMEIVVDTYDEIECASGWHCYLEEQLNFPFAGICKKPISASPMKQDEKLEIQGMADIDVCESEMLVTIRHIDGEFDVPLQEIKPLNVDKTTAQAIEDWKYWVDRGYEF